MPDGRVERLTTRPCRLILYDHDDLVDVDDRAQLVVLGRPETFGPFGTSQNACALRIWKYSNQ